MLRARAQVLSKAPLPLASTRQERLRGAFVDPRDVSHGFMRASDGAITTFDVPGAGTGPGQGTVPENISTPGVVTGQYADASDVNHGFVRAKAGAITTSDVPGAGIGPFQGTVPLYNNRWMRSRESILTRAMCFTDSCEAPNPL